MAEPAEDISSTDRPDPVESVAKVDEEAPDKVDSPQPGVDVQQKQLSPAEIAEKKAAVKALLETIEGRFYIAVGLGYKEHRDKRDPAVQASIKRYKLGELRIIAEMKALATRLTDIYRAIGDPTNVKITNFRYEDWSRHRYPDTVHECRATGINLCKKMPCGKKLLVSAYEGYGNTHGHNDKLRRVIAEAEKLAAELPPVEVAATRLSLRRVLDFIGRKK